MEAIQERQIIQTIGKWKINFGKYNGFTYEEIKRKDAGYLVYLLEKGAYSNEKYKSTNDKIKEYIKLI